MGFERTSPILGRVVDVCHLSGFAMGPEQHEQQIVLFLSLNQVGTLEFSHQFLLLVLRKVADPFQDGGVCFLFRQTFNVGHKPLKPNGGTVFANVWLSAFLGLGRRLSGLFQHYMIHQEKTRMIQHNRCHTHFLKNYRP